MHTPITSYNFKISQYPNGRLKIEAFFKPIKCNYSQKRNNTSSKTLSPKKEQTRMNKSKKDSMRRTKKGIHELFNANHFDYFLTITLSEKFAYYSYTEACALITQWLKKLKRKCPNLVYLCVPAQHKDSNRWHFHICLSNIAEIQDDFEIAICSDTSSPHYGKKIRGKQGRLFYHLKSLNTIGFNVIQKTYGSPQQLANYLIKNIKETPLTKGRKRYSSGGMLKKSKTEKKLIDIKNLYTELCKYGRISNSHFCQFFSKTGFFQLYMSMMIDTNQPFDTNFKIQPFDELLEYFDAYSKLTNDNPLPLINT